jgi:hypothetical protein
MKSSSSYDDIASDDPKPFGGVKTLENYDDLAQKMP